MLEHQEELINALWKIAKPNPEKCQGCGYENSCSPRGCAIIRAAILKIETQSALIKVLKGRYTNEPSTQKPGT